MRIPLLALAMLAACGPVESVEGSTANDTTETEEALVASPPHLKYFGYYASAMSGVGSGNVMAEVAGHANLIWIAGSGDDAKLREARARGFKAVVDVSQYFLDGRFELVPDYQQRWSVAANRFRPDIDTVLAFYPLDEPFYNSRKFGRPDAQTRVVLETIAATVKATFPGVQVAGIFTPGTIVRSDFTIPRGYDLVAFDCYGTWSNCRAEDDHGKKFELEVPELVDRLRAKMNPRQRMFLVPDAFFREGDGTKFFNQLGLVERAKRYYKLATEQGDIIGIVPFLWQSFDDSKHKFIGARDLSSSFGPADVKQMNERIGRKVTHR